MKRVLLVVFLIALLMPVKIKAVETSGRCVIMMEEESNRILYSKNIHDVRSVASISKIMTAVLAVESGKLNDMVSIGDEIDGAYGSAIYVKKDEKMKLEDLVYGLMLRSGNDAALAIAKYVSGSIESFVEEMNKKAKEIGMKNTTFNNPHGLDEGDMKGNFSSAYDMAILASYANKNKMYHKITGTKKHNVSTNKNNYSWTNKNKLLNSYKYTTGGKTGFTQIARRTLVSTAEKGNFKLVVVTLDDGNDFGDHKDLYEFGFSTYKSYKILEKGTINVYDDAYYKDYELYIKNDFIYPLERSEAEQVVLKIELSKQREYKKDSEVGKIIVLLNEKKLMEEKIYIKGLKKQTGLFKKIKKWIAND